MNQVVILTKNCLLNHQLRDKLETLGYEVFCSAELLKQIVNRNDVSFLKLVHLIFFSESVSDDLLEVALEAPEINSKMIFRIDSEEPDEESVSYWKKRGIDMWLQPDTSLKDLREMMGMSFEDNSTFQRTTPQGRLPTLEMVEDLLSIRELKLFQKLWQQQGQFINRRDLAETLWQTGSTESHLAQLSQLVSRIRIKIQRVGFAPTCIETHWKKGYRISDELFASLSDQPIPSEVCGNGY